MGLQKREGRGMKRRYFEVALNVLPDSLMFDEELAERNKSYRQMLTDQPTDEALWLRFIDFQVSSSLLLFYAHYQCQRWT